MVEELARSKYDGAGHGVSQWAKAQATLTEYNSFNNDPISILIEDSESTRQTTFPQVFKVETHGSEPGVLSCQTFEWSDHEGPTSD